MRAGQEGDRTAYSALLHGCVPIVAARVLHLGLTAEQRDFVVCNTLVSLRRLRRTYDPRRPFLPWLHAISGHQTSNVGQFPQRPASKTRSW